MSDLQAIADRVEIEALRGEFTDAADDARLRPLRVAVHTRRRVADALRPRRARRPGGDPRRDRAAAGSLGLLRADHAPGHDPLDGDTASGRAYISELIHLRDGNSDLNYAVYHDRYQRTGDGWKFTERVYEIRYLDTTPLAGSAPHAAGGAR